MDVVVLAVMVVLSVGAVVLIRRSQSGAGIVRRQLARHPESDIATAALGVPVRVTGRVHALGDAPVSEVSGRPWVSRDLRIVVRVDDGAPERPAQETVDLLVDDGTGVALVRGNDVVVAIDRDFEAPPTTLAEQMWADRLLRAGGYHNGSPSTCRLTIYEGVISPGDIVEVVGRPEPVDPDARRRGIHVALRPEKRTPVVMRPVTGP